MEVMVDLETLSTRPNAAITAIGAVAFEGDKLIDDGHFYTAVKLESNEQYNRHMSSSTILWWMQQSELARAHFKDPVAMELYDALHRFALWFESVKGKELWGNGSDFDNVILGTAFSDTGLPAPWKYSNNRCYRTAKSMMNRTLYNSLKAEFPIGVAHNALDDATNQAQILCGWRRLQTR